MTNTGSTTTMPDRPDPAVALPENGIAPDEAGDRGSDEAGDRGRRDAGMATAEYAIATLAACGFAGLLLTILRGNEVKGLLLGIVRSALSVG